MAVKVPEELVRRTSEGCAVLFAGSGLSCPVLPTWTELLRGMLQWEVTQGIIAGEAEIAEAIDSGDLPLAAQALFSACTSGGVPRVSPENLPEAGTAAAAGTPAACLDPVCGDRHDELRHTD